MPRPRARAPRCMKAAPPPRAHQTSSCSLQWRAGLKTQSARTRSTWWGGATGTGGRAAHVSGAQNARAPRRLVGVCARARADAAHQSAEPGRYAGNAAASARPPGDAAPPASSPSAASDGEGGAPPPPRAPPAPATAERPSAPPREASGATAHADPSGCASSARCRQKSVASSGAAICGARSLGGLLQRGATARCCARGARSCG